MREKAVMGVEGIGMIKFLNIQTSGIQASVLCLFVGWLIGFVLIGGIVTLMCLDQDGHRKFGPRGPKHESTRLYNQVGLYLQGS